MVAGLALATPAAASTVSVGSGTLTYAAAAKEVNDLRIVPSGTTLRITDPGATLSVGSGCAFESGSTTRVICDSSAVSRIAVTVADGDDRVQALTGLPTSVTAGDGDDVVTTGSGADVVDLGNGRTGPPGSASAGDVADTGAGDDLVRWTGAFRRIALGAGNDRAVAAAPSSTYATYGVEPPRIEGGDGNDVVDAHDSRLEGLIVLGGAGDDVLTASFGGSGLLGGAGADTLTGGDANDALQGGAGRDTYAGGDGFDVVSYADHATKVSASIDGAANDGQSGEAENVPADVEGLIGGPGDDALTAAADGAGSLLAGCGGADRLTGTPGDDDLSGDRSILTNTNGDGGSSGFTDWYGGVLACPAGSTTGADRLSGLGGDDDLGDLAGADSADGGEGFDAVTFASATASVVADGDGRADDGVSGQAANVRANVEGITGSASADTLTGGVIDNVLVGGDGDDALTGGGGDDTLCGYRPAATAAFAPPDSSLYFTTVDPGTRIQTGRCFDAGSLFYAAPPGPAPAAGDTDTLRGGDGADGLGGGTAGADVLVGNAGADVATFADATTAVSLSRDGNANDGTTDQGANVGADVEGLVGGQGDDTITGGSSADVLDGGPGNDTLSGGAGNDLLFGGNPAPPGFGSASAADVLGGGRGTDTASFADRRTPAFGSPQGVTVTVDGTANDGAPYETVNVKKDVENVTGTAQADTITGSVVGNVLRGLGGDDVLTGGSGADLLSGGLGSDRVSAGNGADEIELVDGQGTDSAACGADADRVTADAGDALTDCETVEIPAGARSSRTASRSAGSSAGSDRSTGPSSRDLADRVVHAAG
jgi:Ca2+-binding RTX toxin-like protein